MISLQAVNQAICTLYQQALDAAGTGAKLVAEDVSKPIIRPSGKVELEDGTDARLLASGRERTVTFRLYYFAKDRERPKLENLAVRGAIGDAFLDGITVEVREGINDGTPGPLMQAVPARQAPDGTWEADLSGLEPP